MATANIVVMGFDEGKLDLPVADHGAGHRPGHQRRSWRRALCIKLILLFGAVCAIRALSKRRCTTGRGASERHRGTPSASLANPDFDWFSVRMPICIGSSWCAHCGVSSRRLKTFTGRRATTTSPCALVSSCPLTTSLRPAMDRMPPSQCYYYSQKIRRTSGARSS